MTIRRSSYLAFASRYTTIGINFVGTIIVARLLTPAEIGVFAVAVAFVTLSQVLRDFGVANYLVQERDLDRARICTAMGIALSTGALLALLIVMLAPFIARFYNEPGMVNVLHILSLTFILTPPSSIGLALLRRNFDFGTAFWFETAGNLAWAVTAVVLAYSGASYRSLGWAALVGSGTMLLLFLVLRPRLVLFRPSFAHWRRVARYGSFDTAANVISQIGILSPAMIMGRMLSFSDVAFYNRGNSLTKMFRDTIESGTRAVALPAFAVQLRQGAFDKAGYLYATTLITGISWPFFALLGLMAYPINRILFGDQWDAAVPIIQYLAVSNIINGLTILAASVTIAAGAVHLSFYREVAIQSTRLILVVTCSFYSVELVAASQIIVYLVALAINQVILNRLVGLTIGDMLRASVRSFAVTILSAVGPVLVTMFYEPTPDRLWTSLLLAATTSLVGWLVGVFAVGHPARNEIAIFFRKAVSSLRASPHRA
jgi:O-antigen/teichoic acid export membrane protein